MNTKNTYTKSEFILKNITEIIKQTSDSGKNGDANSGVKNTSRIIISLNGSLINGRNLLFKTFTGYNLKSIKIMPFFDKSIFFNGREMYMRTGGTPGLLRNFSRFSGNSSAIFRRIYEMSGWFSEVMRSFTGSIRDISDVRRSFPEMLSNHSGSEREFPGLLKQLPGTYFVFPGLIPNFPLLIRVLSGKFSSFPGLFA